jgi:Protein of unknown function (DUF3027)
MPAATMDKVCADAVDLARAAAVELAAASGASGVSGVGDYLGCEAEDERLATHLFASLSPAYVGWNWSVTVVRASRSKVVTVDEVCLLPGAAALLAPEWVPYADRLLPGDLGPGDLLPVDPDDDRLEPGYTGGFEARTGDSEAALDVREVAWELGLARPRVLSLIGMDDAADRWVNGAGGPYVPIAEAAPGHCLTCGFVLRLGGLLGQAFGVCANESSPSDGRVVTYDHGCGAHSEAAVTVSLSAMTAPVLDEVGYDQLGHG